MSKDWLERLESHLPSSKAVDDLSLHITPPHWHPISTAPHNQEFELRINENGEIASLEFPCLHTNDGAWINVDLGTEIKIQPVEWRVWQGEKSPEPHRSKIKTNDRSALFHRDQHALWEIGKFDQQSRLML